ncbi:PEP-CTERM sorting domain-containing protein [Microcystis aeruginosa CS-563/04]|uniref:PEP-CTERM sorting domain-containing protein n=1 Tax=Microcystis aeruginosa TaxID=1126 RepID=UPI00232C905D|nr:PEP-CTERM sorting domain-containing protein [Microcystis aeruginosa]MDB9423273.1 PEP-CTERM sorting domain-containing protein [Microcystis aeruginosa CS-563/04]
MENNLTKILATTTILTIGVSPNCLASNLVSWTISGPGITNAQQLAANEWQLDYTFEPAGFSTRTWTVQAIAPADGDYTFDWNYSGFHSFFRVTAFLNTFNPSTTLYSAGPQNCCTTPSDGFDQSGRFTFSNISAGGTFGFTMGGSNFDVSNILQGTLTLNQVTVPEPSSILSLLALGTLGAASTLKRQLKYSKSSEKETTKVS